MAIKLNTQSFIEKARLVHGDRYDYSKVAYVSSQSKVIIICPVHGEFEQIPASHLNGRGCSKCSFESTANKSRKTTYKFIDEANQIHNGYYEYAKVEYVTIHTKVIITCPIHGDFLQEPNKHLQGYGCPLCSKNPSKLSMEYFIEKGNRVHSGNNYSFDKVVLVNSKTKVIITCPIHGDFEIAPDNFLMGGGCAKCGIIKCAENRKKSTQEFIEQSHLINGDKYDYSKTEYIDSQTKVIITCPVHGDFDIVPNNHLHEQGCPICGRLKGDLNRCKTTQEFVEKSIIEHENYYSYDNTVYINSKTNVIITCPVHGDFEQTPEVHLRGSGCPKCSHRVSAPEQEVIDFVKSIVDCDVETSSRPEFMYGLELDIYIPKYQLAIEFDGLYYHSELSKTKQYHLEKTILCESSNVHLIHIFEDEWMHKQDIVKSRLRNLFGINEHKMYARKCSIIDLSDHRDTVNQFLNDNHIQGSMNYQYAYGLFCGDGVEELVSVMTFNKPRTGIGYSDSEDKGNSIYELSRFCSKLDHNIVGGASRLLSNFIKLFDPESIISYADRRWSYSKNNVYEKLGFTNKTIGDVGYSYIVSGTQRKHRSSFTKSKLVEKMGCSPEDTEHNFCFNHGIYRIYDCGKITYKMIRL